MKSSATQTGGGSTVGGDASSRTPMKQVRLLKVKKEKEPLSGWFLYLLRRYPLLLLGWQSWKLAWEGVMACQVPPSLSCSCSSLLLAHPPPLHLGPRFLPSGLLWRKGTACRLRKKSPRLFIRRRDLVQKAASLQEEHRLTKERWAKAKRDMAELEKAVTWLTKDKRDSNVGASKAKKEQDRI
ncbi:hypothetical protein LWI28_005913 [Acer negundo]|uniref:Uncharacterized protein n=1 Tax=Acer negundo TaxID=4023 RepID=A0AAD5I8P0_ACENE|nr:hypothetical protein LWI28_005913 [Acer negundo]